MSLSRLSGVPVENIAQHQPGRARRQRFAKSPKFPIISASWIIFFLTENSVSCDIGHDFEGAQTGSGREQGAGNSGSPRSKKATANQERALPTPA
jgi:hypothetical protein